MGQTAPKQQQRGIAQPQVVPFQQWEHGEGGHHRQPGGQQWLRGDQKRQGHEWQEDRLLVHLKAR